MIETARFEKVLDLVYRDREPDASGLREFHARNAHDVAITIDDRAAAVTWIEIVADLKEAPLSSVAGAKRRNRSGCHADLWCEIRRRDLTQIELTSERVAERINWGTDA